jgi:hypothetical protein
MNHWEQVVELAPARAEAKERLAAIRRLLSLQEP